MSTVPELIIFDLDDTIIAWESASPDIWEEVCARFAAECGTDPAGLARLIRETGHEYWSDEERHRRGRLDLFNTRRTLVALALAKLGITDQSLINRIADTYSRAREESAFIHPEADAVLSGLRSRGIRLAMATNGAGEMQRGKIERFGLARYFDYILVEGEFGAGKPDERVFRHILEELGAAPEQTWMVGDNLKRDIAPCLALGIFTVWVDAYGGGLPPDSAVRPDRTARNIAELPGLLDEIT